MLQWRTTIKDDNCFPFPKVKPQKKKKKTSKSCSLSFQLPDIETEPMLVAMEDLQMERETDTKKTVDKRVKIKFGSSNLYTANRQ